MPVPDMIKKHGRTALEYAGFILGGLAAGLTAYSRIAAEEFRDGVVYAAVATGTLGLATTFAVKRIDELRKAADKTKATEVEEGRKKEHDALKDKYGGQAKRMVKAVLMHMDRHFFDDEADDERYKHRATLFVCRSGSGPGGCTKWLAIYARAGRHEDSSRTWPLDDNDPEKCRGLAAQLWFHATKGERYSADPWDDQDPASQAKYAKNLGISVDEAKSLNVKSQYFFGTVVVVNNRRWGVLLIDSMVKFLNDAAAHRGRDQKRLIRYAEILAEMLAVVEA